MIWKLNTSSETPRTQRVTSALGHRLRGIPLPVTGAVAALLLVLPDAAAACAVCFDTTAENRMAFMQTTALLSLLPLAMVGGTLTWIRKQGRDDDADPQA